MLLFVLSLALTADSASRHLSPVWAEALQGNEKKALEVLGKIPADSLDGKETRQRACLLKTFVEKKQEKIDAADAFVAGAITVFRDYWTRVLLQELSVKDGEAFLFAQLKAFVAKNGDTTNYATLDDLDEALGPMLLKHGVHSVRGVTSPYYELMTWSEEQTQAYDVTLPEATETVKVVFMDKFASLGWSAFATCGAAHSGGWTKPDALYCVADAYDRKSEVFAVSYLAHEAQHFADNKQFPNLAQPELEYRAKLTELAKADKTAHALIVQFASQAGPSRDSPHAFADQKVVSDLSRTLFGSAAIDDKRLGEALVKTINAAAVTLLKANTQALVVAGAATVTEILK